MGLEELWWACSSLTASESAPTGFDQFQKKHLEGVSFNWLKKLPRLENRMLNTWARWREVVERYSGLELTYEKDRLMALQGVVQHFERKLGVTVRHGLLKEDIIAGLSWYADTKEDMRMNSLFPSWSWASVTAPIRFGVGNLNESWPMRAEFVDYRSEKSEQASGSKDSETITLHGCLKEATLKSRTTTENNTLGQQAMVEGTPIQFQSLSSTSEHGVWLFLLGSGEVSFGRKDDSIVEFGLILLRDADGFYRRTGLFLGAPERAHKVSPLFVRSDVETVTLR